MMACFLGQSLEKCSGYACTSLGKGFDYWAIEHTKGIELLERWEHFAWCLVLFLKIDGFLCCLAQDIIMMIGILVHEKKLWCSFIIVVEYVLALLKIDGFVLVKLSK